MPFTYQSDRKCGLWWAFSGLPKLIHCVETRDNSPKRGVWAAAGLPIRMVYNAVPAKGQWPRSVPNRPKRWSLLCLTAIRWTSVTSAQSLRLFHPMVSVGILSVVCGCQSIRIPLCGLFVLYHGKSVEIRIPVHTSRDFSPDGSSIPTYFIIEQTFI